MLVNKIENERILDTFYCNGVEQAARYTNCDLKGNEQRIWNKCFLETKKKEETEPVQFFKVLLNVAAVNDP